jgi:hypothetical protein
VNLDPQDLELIKQTVRAAVAEATAELVTKSEFRDFRTEVLLAHQQFYPREMVDLMFKDATEDCARVWLAVKDLEAKLAAQGNILAHLWSTTAGRVGLIAGLALQLYELWRLLQP